MTEIGLMNSIRLELSKYGIVHRRHVGVFTTNRKNGRSTTIKIGVPGECDLEFIGQGFVAFIEVKTKNGIVSPEQRRYIKRIQALGHKAGVARSVEDALKIIGMEA